MGSGRVEPLDALYRAVELVFREYGVRVFDLVHVREAWCMVKEGWVGLCMDVVVYLDGGAASVLPCIEGVGGGEGSNCFDDVSEVCLGSIRSPWVRACVGSSIVGE